MLLPLEVRHLAGPRHLRCGRDEPVVLCLAKDAQPWIEAFIQHYTRLGAGHVVLLDNGSTDGTVALAAAHAKVSVWRTRLPFRGNNRQMRRWLVRRFAARDRWALVVDVDEFFDYPCSDRISLGSLLRYLRSRHYSAMVAYQLDMLPDGANGEAEPALPMREAFRHYDISAVARRGYFDADGHGGEQWVAHNRLGNPAIARCVGGVRATAFDLPEVYLIKHPLLLRDGRTRLVHQHFVDHADVADVSGVLYHYKFVPGFRARVEAAVQSRAYADDSWEYRRYQRVLARDEGLALKTPQARRLEGIGELVTQGFLQVSPQYMAWVEDEACSG